MSDLLKDLAVVVNGNAFDHCFDRINCVKFMRTHHATIQQNSEDAKRLRALERAMGEYCAVQWYGATPQKIMVRADEILREGKPHDQD